MNWIEIELNWIELKLNWNVVNWNWNWIEVNWVVSKSNWFVEIELFRNQIGFDMDMNCSELMLNSILDSVELNWKQIELKRIEIEFIWNCFGLNWFEFDFWIDLKLNWIEVGWNRSSWIELIWIKWKWHWIESELNWIDLS